jgi:hypothetical protein
LAAEYFQRFPKERYQTEVESWRHLQSQNAICNRKTPSAIAKHRIHDEAAARADRRRRLNMKESASVGGLYSLGFLLTLLMIGHIPILARHLR